MIEPHVVLVIQLRLCLDTAGHTQAAVQPPAEAIAATTLFCLQPEDNRRFFTKLLHFCISNWEKALVLGILITLIVLVSVKVISCRVFAFTAPLMYLLTSLLGMALCASSFDPSTVQHCRTKSMLSAVQNLFEPQLGTAQHGTACLVALVWSPRY